MIGSLFAPIEVSMNSDLLIIIKEIRKASTSSLFHLCHSIDCGDIGCDSCSVNRARSTFTSVHLSNLYVKVIEVVCE